MAEAIEILREYGVSQMPVVRAEPPVMAAEVAGSVIERDLLDALVHRERQALRPRRGPHVAGAAGNRSRRTGLGRRRALEKADAVVVLEDGKPIGVLTRQDLLGFLAT